MTIHPKNASIPYVRLSFTSLEMGIILNSIHIRVKHQEFLRTESKNFSIYGYFYTFHRFIYAFHRNIEILHKLSNILMWRAKQKVHQVSMAPFLALNTFCTSVKTGATAVNNHIYYSFAISDRYNDIVMVYFLFDRRAYFYQI